MKVNLFTKYMKKVILPEVHISDLSDPFKDRLFGDDLTGSEDFDALIDQLTPGAIQLNLQGQGVPKIAAQNAANRSIQRAHNGDENIRHQVLGVRAIVEQDLQRMMEFHVAGEQTFKFAPGLSDRLLYTAIDVPVGMFKMPYKSIQAIHDNEEAMQVAFDCIDVMRDNPLSGKFLKKPDNLSIIMTSSVVNDVPHVKFSGGLVWGDQIRVFQYGFSLGSDPDVSLLDVINREVDKLERDSQSNGYSVSTHIGNFMQLCMNSALYLVSKDADIGEEKNEYQKLLRKSKAQGLPKRQRDRAKRGLHLAADVNHREVGSNLAPTPFGKLAKSDQDSVSGSGGKLTKRFMVRGHYKNQAYGPGRALRRLIFVEPFEKGPDAAELISRTYDVQDNPDREIVTEGDIDMGM